MLSVFIFINQDRTIDSPATPWYHVNFFSMPTVEQNLSAMAICRKKVQFLSMLDFFKNCIALALPTPCS